MHHDLLLRRALIASWLALPMLARGGKPHPAAPLLLAQEAQSEVDPTGFLVSEKYDGVRAVWDGSSLRFRSGLEVPAPAWFLARLPPTPLDGELWLGRGRFEELVGTVRRHAPGDDAWRQLHYMVFELPDGGGDFAARASRIRRIVQAARWPQLQAVEQSGLDSQQALQRHLFEVVQAGGEGLMLHRANAPYATGRSGVLLKVKPLHDAEARVIGHVAGRGKHAGRLGALRVRTMKDVEFLIGTGFSDAQRSRPPAVGSAVSFTHRGFTDDGVPRFASFLRERSEHF
ncbi:MAG: DNA ligase [Rubrivivax sp.]